MKPGYKTTEFWVSIVIAVSGVLVAMGVITPEQQAGIGEGLNTAIGGIMTVLSSLGYSISRGIAKKGDK
jgi:hypothetical protein